MHVLHATSLLPWVRRSGCKRWPTRKVRWRDAPVQALMLISSSQDCKKLKVRFAVCWSALLSTYTCLHALYPPPALPEQLHGCALGVHLWADIALPPTTATATTVTAMRASFYMFLGCESHWHCSTCNWAASHKLLHTTPHVRKTLLHAFSTVASLQGTLVVGQHARQRLAHISH
jgi:hypothetical protein